MKYSHKKLAIYEEIKQDLIDSFRDFDLQVNYNFQQVDVGDKKPDNQITLEIKQFEGQDASFGIKEFYKLYVTFTITIPETSGGSDLIDSYEDFSKVDYGSELDKRDIAEEVWEHYVANPGYINFDVLDINMLELIHRYPGQSSVYRFDLNIITNNI